MLGLLCFIAMLSCCWALEVPSSLQAQQVIARIAPPLVRALHARGLHYGAPIFLRIFKASKELELWVQERQQFRLFRTYTICAASGELGPKEQEGDLQSPEGFYGVTPEQMNPDSQYHLAFDLYSAHYRKGLCGCVRQNLPPRYANLIGSYLGPL